MPMRFRVYSPSFHLLLIIVSVLQCVHVCLFAEERSDSIRFALVGDPQIGMKGNIIDRDYFELAVHRINSMEPEVEFALILGDMVQGSGDKVQWKLYFDTVSKLKMPYHEVMGNHDGFSPGGIRRWREKWGKKDYYTFNHKGVFFMGLNSYYFRKPDEMPEEYQLQKEFIADRLKANAANPHKFLFIHHALYKKNPDEGDNYQSISLPDRNYILNHLVQYEVKAVFNGHLHYESKHDYLGTRIIGTNPSAKPLGEGKRGFYICDYDLASETLEEEFYENTEDMKAKYLLSKKESEVGNQESK